MLKPGGYVELVEIDVKVKGVGEFAAKWFDVCKYQRVYFFLFYFFSYYPFLSFFCIPAPITHQI